MIWTGLTVSARIMSEPGHEERGESSGLKFCKSEQVYALLTEGKKHLTKQKARLTIMKKAVSIVSLKSGN